jgi:hypothetical protein
MSEPDTLEYQEPVRGMLRQAFAAVPCSRTFSEEGECGPLFTSCFTRASAGFLQLRARGDSLSAAIDTGGHDGYAHRVMTLKPMMRKDRCYSSIHLCSMILS